jgi:anti-sigma B factor antagonist
MIPSTNQATRSFALRREYRPPAVAVVHIEGELDAATSHQLRDLLAEMDCDLRVVVDLSEVDFVDSTVLGVLVLAQKRLLANGGDLLLVYGSPETRRPFELTGLDRIFPECPRDDRSPRLVSRGG